MFNIENIISKIKEKQELSKISSKIIEDRLNLYLTKNNLSLSKLNKNNIKIIVSDIRKDLRQSTGRFTSDSDYNSIKTHRSTNERKEEYELVKSIIYSDSPSSILDMGCGINPLFLAAPNVTYYALDIDESAINQINSFFSKNNISGKAFVYDILNDKSDLPKVDTCIMMKVVDLLDKKGHKNAESLIKKIGAKNYLISFSTKTLSGKPMRHPQRGWIERLLIRLNFKFKLYKTKNELFYYASLN